MNTPGLPRKPTQEDPDPRPTGRALNLRFGMNSVEAQGSLRVIAILQVSQSRVSHAEEYSHEIRKGCGISPWA